MRHRDRANRKMFIENNKRKIETEKENLGERNIRRNNKVAMLKKKQTDIEKSNGETDEARERVRERIPLKKCNIKCYEVKIFEEVYGKKKGKERQKQRDRHTER